MTYEFFIEGPLPGLNEMINGAKLISKNGNKWPSKYSKQKRMHTAKVMCVVNYKQIPTMETIDIEFLWLEKDRKRDPDNITAGAKFILDGLVKCHIIKNDGWKQIKSISHSFDVNKARPGVIVKITDANDKKKSSLENIKCPNCTRPLEKIPIMINNQKIYSKWVCKHCGNEY